MSDILLSMTPVIGDIFGLSNAQAGFLLGGVALIFAIRRWRINTLRKQTQDVVPTEVSVGKATPTSTQNVRMITGEVQALLADLEETSRRLTAQLDNRYTRLELLMQEADQKIQRLEALAQSQGAEPVGKTAAAGPVATTAATRATQVIRGGGGGAAPIVSEAERTLQRLRQERGAPAAGEDPAYQPIFALADRGKSPREIAQELGRQPGEIELILALRRRQAAV